VTDEEIVRKVFGDKQAFGEIISRYEDKIRRYIKRISYIDNDDIDDLIQEIFISAYENLNGFDFRYKFNSWIYRIAHNKTIDLFKKKRIATRPIDQIDDELLKDSKKLLEELEIEKETKNEIRKAMAKMDLKNRELIDLYYFEEKSYTEIADILKTSVNNVGVMILRAKKKLKNIYEQQGKNN